MNTLFIVVLFMAELVNLWWMIFKATAHFELGQIIGWGILSAAMWFLMIGYFLGQENLDVEENNKSKKPQK